MAHLEGVNLKLHDLVKDLLEPDEVVDLVVSENPVGSEEPFSNAELVRVKAPAARAIVRGSRIITIPMIPSPMGMRQCWTTSGRWPMANRK